MPTRLRLLLCTLSLAFASQCLAAAALAGKGLFDPARHMRVAEVKPGMTGYGLTVFSGSKIEKFDVEVLSVLRDFNPGTDVVLIRCKGALLDHAGAIEGMSGSPIFLRDENGHDRMIGAFAYGWSLNKDPIAGVQPIEYMLDIPAGPPATQPATRPADLSGAPMRPSAPPDALAARWNLRKAIPFPGSAAAPRRYPFAGWNSMKPNPALGDVQPGDRRLIPLLTPLSTSGMSQKLIDTWEPVLRQYGIIPLAGGGATTAARDQGADVKLEPGASLAIPYLTGDSEMAAIGTCTEVLGDRIWGFGHPFNNEGAIDLPMGTGYIHTIIPSLTSSFKLGSLLHVRGSLFSDTSLGVAGLRGAAPPTVPIEIHVIYADGSLDKTYRFQATNHPRLTPLIAAMALNAALTAKHELPTFHTVDYDLSLEFSNGQKARAKNVLVNAGAAELFQEIGAPLTAASDNPFEQVALKGLRGVMRISTAARDAQILSVTIPHARFQPGEILKGFINYRPFHDSESILPFTFELPRDLPAGQYQVNVSDWTTYLQEEAQLKPFAFTAQNINEVFDVIREYLAIKHDALYVRLLRKPDGVALGRIAMPRLPSSRREILVGAGLSSVTPFISSTVEILDTPFIMTGAAQFQIQIDQSTKVEKPAAKPGAETPKPPHPAVPKEPLPHPATSPANG